MAEARRFLAAKLIAPVEVSADASNQHEFNAGALRKALDLPAQTSSGDLQIVYMPGDDGESDAETIPYTLYDSREGQPRSPEYRLYYGSSSLQERAAPGDILIVSRASASSDLRALVVPSRTELGRTLAEVLGAEGVALTEKFSRVTAIIPVDALAHLLSTSTESRAIPDAARIVSTVAPAFLRQAIETGKVPRSEAMATEANRVLSELWPGPIDPDERLFWSLEVETALFQHIERLVGQSALDRITAGGQVPFDEAMTLMMSQAQSRKSRRGLSLQHHFAALLDQMGLMFTAQCVTEGKETPDFVMPGHVAYHDASFPQDRLRMVACKSVVRERWRQILQEAARVNEKYLLTLDPNLTGDTLDSMRASRLVVFLPQSVISRSYSDGRSSSVHNVTTLVEQLQQAQVG